MLEGGRAVLGTWGWRRKLSSPCAGGGNDMCGQLKRKRRKFWILTSPSISSSPLPLAQSPSLPTEADTIGSAIAAPAWRRAGPARWWWSAGSEAPLSCDCWCNTIKQGNQGALFLWSNKIVLLLYLAAPSWCCHHCGCDVEPCQHYHQQSDFSHCVWKEKLAFMA